MAPHWPGTPMSTWSECGDGPLLALGKLAEAVGARPYESVDDMFADVDAVAFTTEDAKRVAETVDRAGVRSLVFFTRRFTSNQADWLSDVQGDHGWNSGYVRMYASIFEPDNPYGESQWRRDRGALWDIGPHALSILLPALGPVTSVIADHGLGDTVMLVLHHESGAASTMSLSLTAPPGSRESTLQIFGQDRQTCMPEATTNAVEAMGVSQPCSRTSLAGGNILATCASGATS